jgi:hypothetical protein
MPLFKCKCGNWTNYGLLCAWCQTDLAFEFEYNPDDPLEEEYAEAGMSIVDEDYFESLDDDD